VFALRVGRCYSACKIDRRQGMLVVETVARIRREHFVKGKTIREIARDLGVSRNTVRKVLRSGETSFEYERTVQPRPKLGRWTAEVDELLETNAAKPAREQLTLIRIHGLKIGNVHRCTFAARVETLLADAPELRLAIEPLLEARNMMRKQKVLLDRRLGQIARKDEVCKRLMTIPGVGPVVSLAFKATIDDPARFKDSKAVAAHLGLTPRIYQSGEIDRSGHISKCGDRMMRHALYEAANSHLRISKKWSVVRAQGVKLRPPAPTPITWGNTRPANALPNRCIQCAVATAQSRRLLHHFALSNRVLVLAHAAVRQMISAFWITVSVSTTTAKSTGRVPG
jgi:predicted transcriptional regulator